MFDLTGIILMITLLYVDRDESRIVVTLYCVFGSSDEF